jgi:methanethiol S-methyltransferase
MIDLALLALAYLTASLSMLLFAFGLGGWVDLRLSDAAALAWDAGLSVAFFAQHSVMVRRPFKAWMSRWAPARALGAVYAIASGLVLGAAALLWQRTGVGFGASRGPLRWAGLVLVALAMAGFVWGAASLRGFDPLGVGPLRAHRRGRPMHPPALVIRGAYRWVRHPLYLSVLLLLWAPIDLRADRLLLAVLWTAWILVGTLLEERDLAAELGEPYRDYQRAVPMLLPWRRPEGGS